MASWTGISNRCLDLLSDGGQLLAIVKVFKGENSKGVCHFNTVDLLVPRVVLCMQTGVVLTAGIVWGIGFW